MRSIKSKMKNTLDKINSKLDLAEDKVGRFVVTLKDMVKNGTQRKNHL